MTYILRFGSTRKSTGSAIDCTYWFRIWQEKYLPFIPTPQTKQDCQKNCFSYYSYKTNCLYQYLLSLYKEDIV